MADTRTVTWTLRKPDGTAWEGGVVTFELIGNGYESSNGVQHPGYTVKSSGAAADGTDSISLWQSDQSVEQALYRVTLPSGEQFNVSVPDADTNVDLSTLRSTGVTAWSGLATPDYLRVADYVVIGYQSGQDAVANPIAAAGATMSPAFQVIGDATTDADSAGAFIRRTADAEGASLIFAKSRNTSVGSFTVVQDNDQVGVIAWAADDGSDMGTVVAEIRATIDDASPATSSIGGDLVLSTAAGTGANDLTERVRVSAAGVITVAGANGFDLNVGSDADTDIITLSVGGTPRIWWDESDDRFTLTHGLDIDAGALNASGGGSLTGTWSDLGTVTTVDLNGGTISGVTIDGDLTWSSAQTGVTLTSPTINGTIATTGLTVPALTLSGTLTRAADQTVDLTGAATRTLTLQNSTASQVANLDVDGVLVWRAGHATGSFTFAGTPTAGRTITWTDADQTVNAAADITGTTLASNVVTSSLTTIGTLVAGAVPANLVTAATFAAGTFSFVGSTISDLGTVTTANIDGGTLDGVTIGGASAAAGTFTSVTTSADVIIGNNAGLVIGHTAQVAIGPGNVEFEMLGTAGGDTAFGVGRWSANNAAPSFRFFKSRGASIGTQGIVVTGDNLGQITAYGDDGVDNATESSSIIFDTEGTIGVGQVPGWLRFQTAAAGTLADALTLDSSQNAVFAGVVQVTGNDLTGSAAGTMRVSEGLRVGADSTDNLIDDATNGAGSATLYIGNQSITTSSDVRLKRDIVDTERDPVHILGALRVVDFAWDDPSDPEGWKNQRGRYQGLIAQEAVEVVPWAVNTQGSGDKPWLFEYGYVVPTLVSGWQNHEERLRALEARLT